MSRYRSETSPPRKLPPVTIEELERHLDVLAGLMHRLGRRGPLLLPVYRRVKRELDKKLADDALLADARARVANATARPTLSQPVTPQDQTMAGS